MAKRTNDLSELSRLLNGDEGQNPRRDVAAASDDGKEGGGGAGDRAAALCKLHVQLEKKGRRGKGVTVVKGFFHTKEDLQTFARELKTRCGSGGTAKTDSIEIQGDHRSAVAAYFRSKGFRVTGG